MSEARVEIVLAPAATALERFAADELARYLKDLFGVIAGVTAEPEGKAEYKFVLGLASDPLVRRCAKTTPALSDQGHLVRRVGPDTMLLVGGSPAAVAWAVYELVERYGVRYLLHEDVLPDEPGPFYLPDVDAVFEPVQKLRASAMFIDLPTGSVMWTMEQNKAFIRQLFKLKFNAITVHSYPQAPILEYESGGIRRGSGQLLFGQKIPIDSDNIGLEHLPWIPYLTNPEFAGLQEFPDLLKTGQRFIHALIDESKWLGMYVTMHMQPMEFPLEFAPLLEKPAMGVQLGGLTAAETGDLTNPSHMALVRAQIEAYLSTYGDMDELVLELPENPQAGQTFPECWRELSEKYHLEPEFNIDEMVAAAQANHLPAGGPPRGEREFKSVVSMLHFLDRFFAENDILEKADRQGIKIGAAIGVNAIEAFPVADRVLWDGATFSTSLDYSSSRAVRSMHCMEDINAARLTPSLYIRPQDDNTGSLPQVCTENLHILMQQMHRLGWHGFVADYWPIGDLDPVFAYLARASWDASVTPRDAYDDHFEHVYGRESVEPLCQAMRMLEDATVLTDIDLAPFFPVLGIMDHRVKSDQPMSTVLFHVRATYEQVRKALERLRGLPGPRARTSNLAYWIARMEFAIHALRELELLQEGGMAVHSALAARESGESEVASAQLARARECYDRGISEGETAMRAVASNVRDNSDVGTLAAYYHFLVREVRKGTGEYVREAESLRG